MRALFDLLDRSTEQVVDLPLWDPSAHDAVTAVGPGWTVVSSIELDVLTPSAALARAWSNESVALARGATVIRTAMRFGPGRTDALSRLLAARRDGRARHVALPAPDRRCQPIHEDDLADAIARVAARPRPGRRLTAVGPETLRLDELTRRIADLDGRDVRLHRRIGWSAPWPGVEVLAEDHDTRHDLGWAPRSLDERLRDMLGVRPGEPAGSRSGARRT